MSSVETSRSATVTSMKTSPQSVTSPDHYLRPGHRPRAQVIICVGFFFYLRPGHRPRAQVIICVGFFFCIMFPPLENGQIAQ